ncbi:AAC(3) family N-acetyltransferase [Oceanospirillum sediminis]|uniref:Aminoglycoside N(3)-acetyltransferase n=1 Tax=Oceanospirillum sediminis TaxID=2760088 RepID=A0A839IME0_9GAMM|nr:AAC(3) family N-acetyltransferase [Oceanospirillum sediminis]MBB1485637.1 AAC(3) family N-acetyltransferase [Oceanospirillum sediminis]
MKNSYSKQDIKNALLEVGVKKGSTIFSHSNIGFFGRPEEARNVDEAYKVIANAIFEVIGVSGTLVVPTFTYSFCKKEVFYYDETASNCGVFSELVRKDPASFRSMDPNISVAAIGRKAEALTLDTSKNSYAKDSFFDRFMNERGLVCNMNFDAGSTFVHFVERELKVPYRYDKEFSGVIINSERKELETEYSIFVRDDSTNDTIAAFETFDEIARNNMVFKTHSVGRGFIGCISSEDTFKLIQDEIKKDPGLLIKGEYY